MEVEGRGVGRVPVHVFLVDFLERDLLLLRRRRGGPGAEFMEVFVDLVAEIRGARGV